MSFRKRLEQETKLILAYNDISIILRNLGIDFWLDAGTLLGVVRSGTLLPGDTDFDLGSYYEPIIEEIQNIGWVAYDFGYDVIVNDSKLSFRKEGVSLTIHLYKRTWKYYTKNVIYGKRHRFLGDILNYLFLDGLSAPYADFLHMTPKKKILSIFKGLMVKQAKTIKLHNLFLSFGLRSGCFNYYQLRFPHMYFDNLKEITFVKTKVCIPRNVDDYLSYCYGKNWRVPDPDFPEDGYYRMVEQHSKELKLINDITKI